MSNFVCSQGPAVLRNYSIVKLMRRFPTYTRDAGHRELVWRSLVSLAATDQLDCQRADSAELGREYPGQGIDEGGRRCSGKSTREAFIVSERHGRP